jgi:hypothetical protein
MGCKSSGIHRGVVYNSLLSHNKEGLENENAYDKQKPPMTQKIISVHTKIIGLI